MSLPDVFRIELAFDQCNPFRSSSQEEGRSSTQRSPSKRRNSSQSHQLVIRVGNVDILIERICGQCGRHKIKRGPVDIRVLIFSS